LRFCKTSQAETDASRFIGETVCVCFKPGRFTENSESANYDGGKNISEKDGKLFSDCEGIFSEKPRGISFDIKRRKRVIIFRSVLKSYARSVPNRVILTDFNGF